MGKAQRERESEGREKREGGERKRMVREERGDREGKEKKK